ncbi:hypothetical protein Fmac_021562 [Flemingia macrophylla]|uniref:Uncharacterized protein n=1 Tax=Flemingia macrophylla TaxID=520843 RepID=A0ABD1LXA4_9FABA
MRDNRLGMKDDKLEKKGDSSFFKKKIAEMGYYIRFQTVWRTNDAIDNGETRIAFTSFSEADFLVWEKIGVVGRLGNGIDGKRWKERVCID